MYRGVWTHSTQARESETEEVAVKTVEEELSDADRIKFLQEATIMAQFKHSNIISLKGVLLKNEVNYHEFIYCGVNLIFISLHSR